jgi:diguanylate cyclase (GGDEF)-like protein
VDFAIDHIAPKVTEVSTGWGFRLMEGGQGQKSLLATVSEQMIALEKRDWELWLIAAGAGMLVGVGLLALLFRAAFLQHGLLRLNLAVSPEIFFGFVALLVLFNTYVISRRLELRRTREQVISTTMQTELVRLQSFTDPLTEVYNRRALDEIARRFMSHAKRLKKPLTFMMVDVDRFKDINTGFGHLMGDFVLAEVAAILRGSVRGTDAVVRYGGDEFMVILADADFQGGQVVVDRTSNLLADWNRAGHLKNFELTFSIGVAEWTEGKALDEMLDGADKAMYSTKAARKESSGSGSQASPTRQRAHSSAVARE